jgi:hypothetical protein
MPRSVARGFVLSLVLGKTAVSYLTRVRQNVQFVKCLYVEVPAGREEVVATAADRIPVAARRRRPLAARRRRPLAARGSPDKPFAFSKLCCRHGGSR